MQVIITRHVSPMSLQPQFEHSYVITQRGIQKHTCIQQKYQVVISIQIDNQTYMQAFIDQGNVLTITHAGILIKPICIYIFMRGLYITLGLYPKHVFRSSNFIQDYNPRHVSRSSNITQDYNPMRIFDWICNSLRKHTWFGEVQTKTHQDHRLQSPSLGHRQCGTESASCHRIQSPSVGRRRCGVDSVSCRRLQSPSQQGTESHRVVTPLSPTNVKEM